MKKIALILVILFLTGALAHSDAFFRVGALPNVSASSIDMMPGELLYMEAGVDFDILELFYRSDAVDLRTGAEGLIYLQNHWFGYGEGTMDLLYLTYAFTAELKFRFLYIGYEYRSNRPQADLNFSPIYLFANYNTVHDVYVELRAEF